MASAILFSFKEMTRFCIVPSCRMILRPLSTVSFLPKVFTRAVSPMSPISSINNFKSYQGRGDEHRQQRYNPVLTATAASLALSILARKEENGVHCASGHILSVTKAPTAISRFAIEPLYFVLSVLGRLFLGFLTLCLFYPIAPFPVGIFFYGCQLMQSLPVLQYFAGVGMMICSYSMYAVPALSMLFAAVEPGLRFLKTGQTISAKYAGINEVSRTGGRISGAVAALKGALFAAEAVAVPLIAYMAMAYMKSMLVGTVIGIPAAVALVSAERALLSLADEALGVQVVCAE